MQENALAELYRLREQVEQTDDPDIIADWKKLQTSDHFYYMCTKWFADGDVHKYFNPYNSPYEAYINFMNVLDNLDYRCCEAVDRKQHCDYNADVEQMVKTENAGSSNKLYLSERSVL